MGFALQIADTFYRAFGAGGAVDLAVALSALGKLPTWRYSPRWRRRVRREPLKVLSYFRLLQSYPRLSPQEKRRKRLRQTDLSSVFRLFFSDSWVQCTPPTTLWERGYVRVDVSSPPQFLPRILRWDPFPDLVLVLVAGWPSGPYRLDSRGVLCGIRLLGTGGWQNLLAGLLQGESR